MKTQEAMAEVVPPAHRSIEGFPISVQGKWVRTASIEDEEWVEEDPSKKAQALISKMTEHGALADIFTFAQRIGDSEVRHKYPFDWDNYAVIPITTFDEWWNNRLPQETRKNVRRAQKRGLEVRQATFDDALVDGISAIYNETPIRQGRKFWHYGKPLEAVRKENSTYLDRAVFLGAYVGEELIGFLKFVCVGRVASLMQILSKEAHQDKRPTNALLAEAVNACVHRNASHLVYGKYQYGNKSGSALAEFKKRNGFEKLDYPRYFVPLTMRGRAYIALRLHRGLHDWLPASALSWALAAREWSYRRGLLSPASQQETR